MAQREQPENLSGTTTEHPVKVHVKSQNDAGYKVANIVIAMECNSETENAA